MRTFPKGTQLRVTMAERTTGTDTSARQGFYLVVETTFEDDLSSMLRNEPFSGEPFTPGECVDVEHKHGDYIGRYRLASEGLVELPSLPTKTSGGVVATTLPVVLHDQGDEGDQPLEATVAVSGNWIEVKPKGYGDCGTQPGYGSPIGIEFYNGRLRVVLHADINTEDPQVIDMEGARESNRIDHDE